MSNGKTELLQGTLDMLILKTAALGAVHGYGVAQRLKQMSRHVLQVRQGSLYPALHRLEKQGLLKAEWLTTDTGRQAKYYRLTAAGKKRLEGETRDWEALSGAISAVLRTVSQEG
jgi:PadR family transcriptional regulator, regulatory protein PadR